MVNIIFLGKLMKNTYAKYPPILEQHQT